MGKELEYKLYVPDAATLDKIFCDADIAALAVGAWRETRMKTAYFDAPDRRFSARRWALRLRMEDSKSVVCLKTPSGDPYTRCEWQFATPALNESSIQALVALGAPPELLQLYADDVRPVCGAEFLRRSVMLRFPDQSRAELALDHGFLCGENQRLPFAEAELELYEGTAEKTREFAQRLCTRYRLSVCSESKFARARLLK